MTLINLTLRKLFYITNIVLLIFFSYCNIENTSENALLDFSQSVFATYSNEFILSIKNNNTEKFHSLLNNPNTDVNFKDSEGKTALMHSVEQENKEKVKLLLKHRNINVNIQDKVGDSALILASRLDNHDIAYEISKLLLNKNYTSYVNKIDINLQNTSDNFAELNKKNALMWSSKTGNKKLTNLLLSKPEINVNLYDNIQRTALIIATEHNKEEIVELLLSSSIIDNTHINLTKQDDKGNTALIYAVKNNNKNIVTKILKETNSCVGFNIANHTNKTPLQIAEDNNFKKIAKLLKCYNTEKIKSTSGNINSCFSN